MQDALGLQNWTPAVYTPQPALLSENEDTEGLLDDKDQNLNSNSLLAPRYEVMESKTYANSAQAPPTMLPFFATAPSINSIEEGIDPSPRPIAQAIALPKVKPSLVRHINIASQVFLELNNEP